MTSRSRRGGECQKDSPASAKDSPASAKDSPASARSMSSRSRSGGESQKDGPTSAKDGPTSARSMTSRSRRDGESQSMTSRSRRGGESQKDRPTNARSMTSRSRRGGESQKDSPASASTRDNDGHNGSQGAGTSGNSEISHPPARGIVSMLKVQKNRSKGIFVKVNWNELGQPIGKESITLAHYVGALARRTFPITITDFRKKKLTLAKEAFWDEIVATFTGLDESHKKALISRAGYHHRLFRTRLRNLARDANGNYSAAPPFMYRELSTVTPYWNEFVEQALNEEFKAKSKKNKERAKAMEARYKSACADDSEALQILEDVPEYLEDTDITSTRFSQRSNVYGAWEQFLGLEHSDNPPKRSHSANQAHELALGHGTAAVEKKGIACISTSSGLKIVNVKDLPPSVEDDPESWRGFPVGKDHANLLHYAEVEYPDFFNDVKYSSVRRAIHSLNLFASNLANLASEKHGHLSRDDFQVMRGELSDLESDGFRIRWAIESVDRVFTVCFQLPLQQEITKLTADLLICGGEIEDLQQKSASLKEKIEHAEKELAVIEKDMGEAKLRKKEIANEIETRDRLLAEYNSILH